jgi:hypothetical protein
MPRKPRLATPPTKPAPQPVITRYDPTIPSRAAAQAAVRDRAQAAALRLAGGDDRRLVTGDDGSVIVANRPSAARRA